MTTKTKEALNVPQEEVIIEGHKAEVSADLRRMVNKKIRNLTGMWQERREAHKTTLESAAPTLPGGYRYWDCLLLGPYQESTLDLPAKIIKADEPTMMVGLIWVNPAADPSGGVSGTVVMGGREYYTCFEMIDLSYVLNIALPGSDQKNTFPDVPPEFTPIYWEFSLPDPGEHPRLFELHFYADIVRVGQPFATMATWHRDPEGDGWFPGWTPSGVPAGYDVPNVPPAWLPTWPHFDHDIPARFLVHRA